MGRSNRSSSNRWGARSLAGTVLAGLAMLAGCQAAGPLGAGQEHPTWPSTPPPDAPRLVHVLNITGPRDLGGRGAMRSLGEFLTGKTPAMLDRPTGVAVTEDGRIFVADQERQALHVLRWNSGKGKVIHKAGELYFVSPAAVAVYGQRVAVSDSGLNQVFLFSLEGKYLGALAAPPAGFKRPTGMACDRATGELYVVDTLGHGVHVYDAMGKHERSFGSPGRDVGQFNYPTHVFVAGDRVYVTDSLNFRVQVLDREGKYVSEIGQLGDATGYMAVPKGVCVDSLGHVYVVDSYFSAVQVFDEKGQLLLSIGGPGGRSGEFQVPTGLAVDGQDRIYVADSYNHRVQVIQYVGGTNHETP